MNHAVRSLLIDLIRGLNLSTAEIDDHLQRLARIRERVAADPLPEGWERWTEELREMEREGLVRVEGEGWLVVPTKPRPKQETLF